MKRKDWSFQMEDEGEMPWLDMQLSKETMDYLWGIINHPTPQQQTDASANKTLAGNISKSYYIQDKDNWFYENVLKLCAETIYFKEWANYYNVHIVKEVPPPVFTLERLWVNYQKQHEFNPPHNHSGHFSFVMFMKIPTHWKEQHALPFAINSNGPTASDFQFLLGQKSGFVEVANIPLSSEDEGRLLFFPAWLLHQVFPFYGTEEERITISGNIVDNTFPSPEMQVDILEKDIETMQKQKAHLKKTAFPKEML